MKPCHLYLMGDFKILSKPILLCSVFIFFIIGMNSTQASNTFKRLEGASWILTGELKVRKRSKEVFIQDDRTKRPAFELDRYRTYCKVTLKQRGDFERILRGGSFFVTDVKSMESVNDSLTQGVYDMYVSSTKHPDVTMISCYWNADERNILSIDEIEKVVKKFFKLELPGTASAPNNSNN